MGKATTISIEGDREYVETINGLAKAMKTTAAALVRQAVDQKFGQQLEVVRLHNAKLGQKIIHSGNGLAGDVAS